MIDFSLDTGTNFVNKIITPLKRKVNIFVQMCSIIYINFLLWCIQSIYESATIPLFQKKSSGDQCLNH